MKLFNSLTFRLILSAIVMVVVVVPIVGVTLNSAFENQAKRAYLEELKASSYSVLTLAEVEGHKLVMPEVLLDERYNVSQSGAYAILSKTSTAALLWRSASMLGLSFPQQLQYPKLGESRFYEVSLQGKRHFVYSFSVSYASADTDFPLTVHILKDKSSFTADIESYRQTLWQWLVGLMVLLISVQFFWLYWVAKPIRQLSIELNDVELGESQQLEQRYPNELIPVVEQLNALLINEQQQRQRHRNALSDLAHSLKTPLAIIQTEAHLSEKVLQQTQAINQSIEHQLKRAQSAAKDSWRQKVNVTRIVEKLLDAMSKIYHDKGIVFESSLEDELKFKGDEQDFMEIVGNLLDNACKAASHKVSISSLSKNTQILISIEDDGCGIDQSKIEEILKRGTRADTYSQGHGVGLAIVKDLVESYHGQLEITHSERFNGAKFSISLPSF